MLTLPKPVQAYFEANAELNAKVMLEQFSSDAIVRDEGRTHRGTEAIRAWITETIREYRAVATPQSIQSDGDSHRIAAHVAGNFPGSPVDLAFHVQVSENHIAKLEIR